MSSPRAISQSAIDLARSSAVAATLSVVTLISEPAFDLCCDLVSGLAVGSDE